jgi:hypothetical protein
MEEDWEIKIQEELLVEKLQRRLIIQSIRNFYHLVVRKDQSLPVLPKLILVIEVLLSRNQNQYVKNRFKNEVMD